VAVVNPPVLAAVMIPMILTSNLKVSCKYRGNTVDITWFMTNIRVKLMTQITMSFHGMRLFKESPREGVLVDAIPVALPIVLNSLDKNARKQLTLIKPKVM
jgi:hypothetical protein